MGYTPGQGTKIQIKITSTFTDIADVLEIAGPGLTIPKVKTTNLASVRQTYRPGLPDAGEVTFTIQFQPADTTHALLFSKSLTPVVDDWKIVFDDADHSELAFNGFVSGFNCTNMTTDENVEAELTITLGDTISLTTPEE